MSTGPVTEAPTEEAREDHNAARLYRDAGALLARCSGYWLDQQDEKNGWRIYYAVDADVVVSYVDPDRNTRHGGLFALDNALARTLVRMIGDFIMKSLRGGNCSAEDNGSLLVISPHDEELHSRLLRAQKEAYDLRREAWRVAEEKVAALRADVSESEFAAVLVDNAEAVIEMFEQRGQLEKLRRFNQLPKYRLMNTQRYEEPDEGTPFKFPAPPDDASYSGFESYARIFGRWQQRLRRTGGHKSSWAVGNDAKVLTFLEWVNARIADQRRRLVLITGSDNIFSAASKKADVQAGESSEPAELLDCEEFERLYLRHPQAFLGDRDFFRTPNPDLTTRENATELRVFDWLNLLFPDFVDSDTEGSVRGREHLKKALEAPLSAWEDRAAALRAAPSLTDEDEGGGNLLESLVATWKKQVRTVELERRMEQRTAVATWLAGVLRNKNNVRFGPLANSISNLAELSRAKLYVSTSEATFRDPQTSVADGIHSHAFLGEFVVHRTQGSIRGVPALRFEKEYEAVQKTCDTLQDMMFSGTLRVDIQALYRQFNGIDSEGYHALVVHALVFAIRGHWHGTKTLCKSALAVADSIPEETKKKRTGREAAYLLAIAERRLAHNEKGMQKWRHYIDMAQRRENPGAAPDPRFASEHLAGDVTGYTLPYLGDPGNTLIRVGFVENVLNVGQNVLKGMTDDELPQVRAWVTRQVYCNVLGIALFAELREKGVTARWQEDFNSLAAAFRALSLSPDNKGKYLDVFSNVVYWVGTTVYDTDGDRKRSAIAELKSVDPAAFPLDRQRVKILREVGLRAAKDLGHTRH